MFIIIKELPEDILGNLISGKTTVEDYERLNPIMEQYEQNHNHIKILMEIAELNYTSGALWEDIKFGFKHLKAISAIAIVSDKKWLEKSVEALGSIIPGITTKGFENSEVNQAITWQKSS
ncbi:MAG: STAS/SEC14 domain-containing protein [Aquaticitalea sp.]